MHAHSLRQTEYGYVDTNHQGEETKDRGEDAERSSFGGDRDKRYDARGIQ
jgi:hypothetical protein